MTQPLKSIACANLFFLSLGGFLAPYSYAQGYPVKPIRILVGFSAGGGTDVTARIVAQKLSENVGQGVVVENRPGANTTLATERVATSPPDGYTLLLMPTSTTVQSALNRKLTYDLVKDFTPVSLVASGALAVVVHPSVPARNIKDLVALARAKPGKLNFGSAGIGGATHLAGELFNVMAKVTIVHVPYKGGSESVVGVAAGHVDMAITSVASALPLLRMDRVRILAVTSAKRVALAPTVPSLDEAGLPGYEYSVWYGILAPAGASSEVVSRLQGAIKKSVHSPEVEKALNREGFEPLTSTTEEFATAIRDAIRQNAKLIERSGLKLE